MGDGWINASAATGKVYLGQIEIYSFHKNSLRGLFPYEELREHMLMNASLNKKKGYEKFRFRFDSKSYGGNVFYTRDSKGEYETCFGQGYELFIDVLDLKHNKPKTAWIKLAENKSISDIL